VEISLVQRIKIGERDDAGRYGSGQLIGGKVEFLQIGERSNSRWNGSRELVGAQVPGNREVSIRGFHNNRHSYRKFSFESEPITDGIVPFS